MSPDGLKLVWVARREAHPRSREGARALTNEGCATRRAIPLAFSRGARRRERRRAYPGPRSKNTGGGALAKSAVRKVNVGMNRETCARGFISRRKNIF